VLEVAIVTPLLSVMILLRGLRRPKSEADVDIAEGPEAPRDHGEVGGKYEPTETA
jgi:hypothetical protein